MFFFLIFFYCLRVYLNIIYTIVEVMRYTDPGDSEEMGEAWQTFFTELSKYIVMLHFGLNSLGKENETGLIISYFLK